MQKIDQKKNKTKITQQSSRLCHVSFIYSVKKDSKTAHISDNSTLKPAEVQQNTAVSPKYNNVFLWFRNKYK